MFWTKKIDSNYDKFNNLTSYYFRNLYIAWFYSIEAERKPKDDVTYHDIYLKKFLELNKYTAVGVKKNVNELFLEQELVDYINTNHDKIDSDRFVSELCLKILMKCIGIKELSKVRKKYGNQVNQIFGQQGNYYKNLYSGKHRLLYMNYIDLFYSLLTDIYRLMDGEKNIMANSEKATISQEVKEFMIPKLNNSLASYEEYYKEFGAGLLLTYTEMDGELNEMQQINQIIKSLDGFETESITSFDDIENYVFQIVKLIINCNLFSKIEINDISMQTQLKEGIPNYTSKLFKGRKLQDLMAFKISDN